MSVNGSSSVCLYPMGQPSDGSFEISNTKTKKIDDLILAADECMKYDKTDNYLKYKIIDVKAQSSQDEVKVCKRNTNQIKWKAERAYQSFISSAIKVANKITDPALKSQLLTKISQSYASNAKKSFYTQENDEDFNYFMIEAEKVAQLIPIEKERQTILQSCALTAVIFGKLIQDFPKCVEFSSQDLEKIFQKYLKLGRLDDGLRVALLIPSDQVRSVILKELYDVFLKDELNLTRSDILEIPLLIPDENIRNQALSALCLATFQRLNREINTYGDIDSSAGLEMILGYAKRISDSRIFNKTIQHLVQDMLSNNFFIEKIINVASLINEVGGTAKVYSDLVSACIRKKDFESAQRVAVKIKDKEILCTTLINISEAYQKSSSLILPGYTDEVRSDIIPSKVSELISYMPMCQKKDFYLEDLFKRYFKAGKITAAVCFATLIPDQHKQESLLKLGRRVQEIESALALGKKKNERNLAFFKIFSEYIKEGNVEKAHALMLRYIDDYSIGQQARMILNKVYPLKMNDFVVTGSVSFPLEELELLNLK